MVIHLATVLDVPLRERNAMLVAAGFAPIYRETGLDEPAMAQVRHVLEFLLHAHEPYPAFVIDRQWDVVKSNEAAKRLTAVLMGGTAVPADGNINVMRLSLHPAGLRSVMVNWSEAATMVMDRLRREAAERPTDDTLHALLAEAASYEGVADLPRKIAPAGGDLLLPVHYRSGDVDVRLFGTIATLGASYDVTVEELRLETFFPADEDSEQVLRRLAATASHAETAADR